MTNTIKDTLLQGLVGFLFALLFAGCGPTFDPASLITNTRIVGARIEVEGGFRADALLFGESHARMIVSVRRRHLTRLREIARREDVPISVIGEVRGRRLEIGDLIGLDVTTLRDCWRNGLTKALAGSASA